ncbi:excalibur calcium-binding domain-containing protein [Nocardioides sp. J2M5]|uniref:excalibur calcium-binding domain-containing protein n=1 Tax=Nocardioides palaemonis TaxID=2829810 RepID=UPI001BA9F97D|nr:excalibur calcium-binding domain-containing protein [Nocardioides palaemonis]MBS2936597.1 excalibur calcium-binding domain-containing protein [Nocardioides palaemonis]
MRKKLAGAVACLTIGAPLLVLVTPAEAAVPAQWQNCTVVNNRLPHGVGRANARDRTSGTPVTNFRRDTALYNTAMRANRGLDRDGDGIACEKA